MAENGHPGPAGQVYNLLVPVQVTYGDQTRTLNALRLRPVTWAIERRWERGQIQGENGALEALIREVVVEPFLCVEALVHPDTGRFMAAFLMHLPEQIRENLASGHYPAPEFRMPPQTPPPTEPHPGDYDPGDDAPYIGPEHDPDQLFPSIEEMPEDGQRFSPAAGGDGMAPDIVRRGDEGEIQREPGKPDYGVDIE